MRVSFTAILGVKSWRARVLGYEEVFRRSDDEKSPEFTGSNVVAREKELEALVGYAAAAAAR